MARDDPLRIRRPRTREEYEEMREEAREMHEDLQERLFEPFGFDDREFSFPSFEEFRECEALTVYGNVPVIESRSLAREREEESSNG